MALTYNRCFAPYVIPAGFPTDLDQLPTLGWFGVMLKGQIRAELGRRKSDLSAALPLALRTGPVGRLLDAFEERVVGVQPGKLPAGGDAELAYRRFAGINPLSIRRVRSVDELPARLRLSDEVFSRLVGAPQSFAARVARGDLLLLDLSALRVPGGTAPQTGKFVAPANGLFCLAPEVDAPFPVVPLAIECPAGSADGETTVVTADEGERWRAARWLLDVADVNYGELCLHLSRAHSMTTPFTLALHRRVPKRHPLYDFLLPHLRNNVFVQFMAWNAGIKTSDSILVGSLAGEAKWSQDVARRLYDQLSFREQHFERDLEARGVADLPCDYPYRDDGRLLWGAIRAFVQAFLERLYPTEAALADDAVVHAFLDEVRSPEGGNVRGLLEGERLASRAELVEVLTQVLFVAGPLHSCFHYTSASELQDVDHNPSWLTGNPLVEGAAALPGRTAWRQVRRVVSGNRHNSRLGDFSADRLGRRPEVQDLVRDFQTALAEVERTIQERNLRRFAPYIHFLPSRIGNGITA